MLSALVPEHIEVRFQDQVVKLESGAILGRSRSADLTLPLDVVSRKHAQLHHGNGGWFLADLGSANGIYSSDGERRDLITLPPGTTTITLGPPASRCEIELIVDEVLAEAVTVVATPRWTEVAGPDQPGSASRRPYRPAIQGPGADYGLAAEAAVRRAAATATGRSSPPSPARPNKGVGVRADGLSVVVDGDLVILNDASLTIEPGTLTAIIGPSGCGKSTLANLLSGRSEPTRGTVAVDGEPLTADVRKRIGVVPQHDAVHERLTVRHTLASAARLRLTAGTPRAAIDDAVDRTAATLDLSHRLDTRVQKLSGGQKKRVSVGYELVAEPVMMVLDEPTAGLDPGLEQELIDELRALADKGTTTVLVTHSTEAAEEADLVVVLAPGGHVAFVGPPSDVLVHFGAGEWPDVFGRLDEESGPRWAAYFSGTEAYRRHVAPPTNPVAQTRQALGSSHRRSWFGDFRVMVGRYGRAILADPKSLMLLLAQAPVLGVLFAFVLSRNVFTQSVRPSTAAREFVLALVLAMVWIGASNSIREIVKERRTFLRERAVGVAPSSLVASRWVLLAGITVLQAIVLFFAATSRQRSPVGDGVLFGSGKVELIAALALVGLASVGIGLLLSGVVADANKAMAVLPIVLIPIVLFSGLLIPTAGKLGLEQVSYLNPIQWGSSAAATTSDILAREGCNPTGLEAQLQQVFLGRTISCSNPRWQTEASAQAINFAVGAFSLIVLTIATFAATARSTRVIRI